MRRVITANGFAVVLILITVAVAAPAVERTSRTLPLPLHTRVTLTGQTLGSRPGLHMKGHVFATARWNQGGRYVVATPVTDSLGRWHVSFRPSHRGFYALRILTPDAAVLDYAFTVR
jgi:hypothetical protein